MVKDTFLFYLHIITIIIFNLSFLLFDYRLIILGVFLYYLQIFIFGNCILTTLQFGKSKNNSFYHYLLDKLGIKLRKENVNFFIIYVKPSLVIIISLMWQLILNFTPLIF